MNGADRLLHRMMVRRAAAELLAAGMPLFPLSPQSKMPLLPKCPESRGLAGQPLEAHTASCARDGHGQYDATFDPDRIERWLRRCPELNWATPVTPATGRLVVDLDGPAAVEAFQELQRRHGTVPETLITATPGRGGGWHLWFRHPGGDLKGRLAPGIDVKHAGYVAVPPSLHPEGGRYRWHDPGAPIAALPGWLLDLIRPTAPTRPERLVPVATGAEGLTRLVQFVAGSREGERNRRLFWAACRAGELTSAGQVGQQTARDALVDAAQACGLSPHEAERTITSAWRRVG